MVKLVSKANKTVRFCKGLTSPEFACQCTFEECRGTIISRKLISSYANFRELVGVRLKINSGFRCTRHNFEVGGKPLSRHTTGQAIDISLKTLDHLSENDIEHAAKSCGFTFIKFYKTFVHLDVR